MQYIQGIKNKNKQNIRLLIFIKSMAQGKNKKNFGKKGQKKKTVDPMSRKEWFTLRAPAPFKPESFGYTCANRTQGLKKVEDAIRGRVVTSIQTDLANNQENFAWRKIKLIVDETRGKEALTSFYGVDTTRDQLSAIIKKRRTLIEAVQDCKSADGYVIRVFVIAFTRESPNQKRKTNYALASQQKEIRRRINDFITKQVAKSSATQLFNFFTSDVLEKKIEKEVSAIYPVKNIKIRKVKVIQRPKVDSTKLAEMHEAERTLMKVDANKKTFKGDRKKGPKVEESKEAVNLVNREQ